MNETNEPISATLSKSAPIQELTYGQKAVGLSFNPSNNPSVQTIKTQYASIIDSLNQAIAEMPVNDAGLPSNPERIRLYKIAITEAQSAQMWAVKAITWQY